MRPQSCHWFFWRVHIHIFTEINTIDWISPWREWFSDVFVALLGRWKIGKYYPALGHMQIASKHFCKLEELVEDKIKHELFRSILPIFSSYVKPTQSLPPTTPAALFTPHQLQHHCLGGYACRTVPPSYFQEHESVPNSVVDSSIGSYCGF